MIGIHGEKSFSRRKRKRRKRHLLFNLLCFQKMQMVNRPSASFHSTFFNDIPYHIFGNAVERCRKRRKPSKSYIPSIDHGKKVLAFTFDKKEHISHIRDPPGYVERNGSLQHDQEAFFVRNLSFLIISNCYENLIIILILKVKGFFTFNIYAGVRERRYGLNACG